MQNYDYEKVDLQKAFHDFEIATGVLAKEIAKILQKIIQYAKSIIESFEEFDWTAYYDALKKRKAIYNLDLTRPKIQHQVLERKPQNLILKII